VGDFNNDGHIDLLIGRQNSETSASTPLFLKNMGRDNSGKTSFLDVSREVGFTSLPASVKAMGFAVADYDNDGLLDIYIASYDLSFSMDVMISTANDDPNVLLQNQGSEHGIPIFSDITESANVAGSLSFGRTDATQGISWRNHTFVTYASDVNHDGLTDIFALNETPGYVDLFINQGDMNFVLAEQQSLAQSGGWMGISSSDIDADGYLDYFITNLGSAMSQIPVPPGTNVSAPTEAGGTIHHLLLKGSQEGILRDVAAQTPVVASGVLPPEDIAAFSGLNAYELGWGNSFIDVDNRGWDDLYWVGSHYEGFAFNGVGRFLFNDAEGGFIDQTYERGLFNIPPENPLAFGQSYNGYSVLRGDLNRDGHIDLVVINGGDSPAPFASGGLRIFMNSGHDKNRSLSISLKSHTSNRYGIGALVEVRKVSFKHGESHRIGFNGPGQLKEMVTTTGAFSGVQPELHFGLGSDYTAVVIRVRWPGGHKSIRVVRSTESHITINEGSRGHR